MENKPVKRTNLKLDTVVTLEQKIEKLQIQIARLQHKILKLDTIKLKQEQKIIRLQTALNKSESESGDIILHVTPSSLKGKK